MRGSSLVALLCAAGCAVPPPGSDGVTSAQPLTLSPTIDVDPTSRPSELRVNSIAVANDGQNFVVAWPEPRSVVEEIYTARVSPTGALLDPYSVRASRSQSRQGTALSFAFAIGGGRQFTAWQEWADSAVEIRGALGAPGQTPTTPRFDLLSRESMAGALACTWDGTSFDLVMPRGSTPELILLRVFPDGGTGPRTQLLPPVPFARDVTGIALSNDRVGVTSYENTGSAFVQHFTLVDATSGTPLGTQTLSSALRVGGDARGFVVAGAELVLGKNHVILRRLAADGSPMTDGGTDVTSTSSSEAPWGVGELPNGDTVIAYVDQTKSFAGIKQLGEDGGVFTVVRDELSTDGGNANTAVKLSCLGSNCLLAWHHVGTPDTVTAAVYTQGAGMGPAFPLRQTSRSQWSPNAAFAQDRYLVTWLESTNSTREVFGRLLDESGAPLSGPFRIALVTNQFTAVPARGALDVVELGGRFLVVYSRANPLQVIGQLVELDGGVGAPFNVSPAATSGLYEVSAASSDAGALVVWATFGSRFLAHAARIAPDGSVLDPTGILLADVGVSMAPQLAVSPGERGHQVLWSHPALDLGPNTARLFTASVFADGGGVNETKALLLTLSGTDYQPAVSLGFDGVRHVATFRDLSAPQPQIRLIQFDEDGGIAGDGGERLSTPGSLIFPGELTCGDGECVALYSETSGGIYELRGLRLSADGGRESFGASLATDADDQFVPSHAPGREGGLLVWGRYQGAPYGSLRVASRVIDGPVAVADAGGDDAGVPDGGSAADGGIDDLERQQLKVSCGCGVASGVELCAILIAVVGLQRARRTGARGTKGEPFVY